MRQPQVDPERKARPRLPDTIMTQAKAAGVRPLVWMLNIVRDVKADPAERDRMTAIAVRFLRGGR